MLKLCGMILLGTLMIAASKRQEPPKELVEYVQKTKKLGLTDEQIRQNAVKGGWELRLVDEALNTSSRPSTGTPDGDLPDGYRIGAGDVLQVSVWREPDASVAAATVRGDGKISLPLVKEVELAGLTPTEAEQMLTQKLARFVHGADVTVVVREVNSRKIYLVGALRRVGAIDMRGRITILQAITEAGGLNDFAKRRQIYVLRNEGGKQLRIPFDYDAFIDGERTDQNILLFPNDTIVVPQ
jgi:polysaccharide biosynthesis/export protein